jgi:hypothetical protein
MKLVGLMPVRNEDWCLGFTVRVALKWCDEVIVLDHASTDNTRAIIYEVLNEQEHGHCKALFWMHEDDPAWNEMAHRQKMLDGARERGATHIAIIDADEFLTANLLPDIRSYVLLSAPGSLPELPGYNVREPGWQYHSNGVWGNRWFATAFQDSPVLNWSGDRFHHREPMGCNWNRWRPVNQGEGGVLHLWGASERRLRAKHALYRLTERLRWPSKPTQDIERLYSLATTPREPWTFQAVPPAWIEPYADLMQYLDIDAVPWQEKEIATVLSTYGREHFAGLDLLGF